MCCLVNSSDIPLMLSSCQQGPQRKWMAWNWFSSSPEKCQRPNMFLYTVVIYWSYFACMGACIDEWLCVNKFLVSACDYGLRHKPKSQKVDPLLADHIPFCRENIHCCFPNVDLQHGGNIKNKFGQSVLLHHPFRFVKIKFKIGSMFIGRKHCPDNFRTAHTYKSKCSALRNLVAWCFHQPIINSRSSRINQLLTYIVLSSQWKQLWCSEMRHCLYSVSAEVHEKRLKHWIWYNITIRSSMCIQQTCGLHNSVQMIGNTNGEVCNTL
jgi:hypothetical protein